MVRALDLPTAQSPAETHWPRVDDAFRDDTAAQDDHWLQSLAAGSESFVRHVRAPLGIRAVDRPVHRETDASHLAEDPAPYSHIPDRPLPLQANNQCRSGGNPLIAPYS